MSKPGCEKYANWQLERDNSNWLCHRTGMDMLHSRKFFVVSPPEFVHQTHSSAHGNSTTRTVPALFGGLNANARCSRFQAVVLLAAVLAVLGGNAVFAQEPENGKSDQVKTVETNTGGPASKNSENERTTGIPTHPVAIMAELRWWIVPFVLASVIALWFGIERLVVLRRGRVIPRAFVDRFLEHLEQGKLDAAGALRICEQSDSPVAAVFAHGVRKWGKPSVEVEQAIIDGGERQVSQLRKHLRVLNGVATVTPLMGLLGTVVGMIQAFNDIAVAGAMGRADQLAVGIAMALLTTAFGLAIAIPSLIMYMYLAGRVDALVMEMDLLAQNVVHLIAAEGLAAKSDSRPKPPAPKAKRKRAETKEPV